MILNWCSLQFCLLTKETSPACKMEVLSMSPAFWSKTVTQWRYWDRYKLKKMFKKYKPKCPPTEEWIKKLWNICTIRYHSALTKNEIMPLAATWMDLDHHTKWSQSERGRQLSYDITYTWNLTQTHRHRKQIQWLPQEKGGGGINEEFGINRYTLLYIK